jgi:hypothetical protein
MAVERPGHSSDASNADEVFEAHVAPARGALAALLDASDQLRDEWGSLSAADSQAMAELAAGAEFKGSSTWGDPVHAAHNLGLAPLCHERLREGVGWGVIVGRQSGLRARRPRPLLAGTFEQGLVAVRTDNRLTPARRPRDERTDLRTVSTESPPADPGGGGGEHLSA